MKFFSPRIPFLALLLSLLLSTVPQALGRKGREGREVSIASVQGDVRLSHGRDHHPDLNTPWQEALGGELVVEGSALATGNGRAEVEFEDGSRVYLAENSLLLFKGLSAPGDHVLSRMAVATGRATFSMQPAIKESFFIDTPEQTPIGFHRYSVVCDNGYWVHERGHYARVLTRQTPSGCVGSKCIVRAPRPVWVRAGKRLGFVPPHPNDVRGKPPINLKEGLLIPPAKPGERVERVALEPSQKVSVLDKAPREVPSEPVNQALHVSAPEIHAHLLQEAFPNRSLSLSARVLLQITYDYKSHHFVTPVSATARGKSQEVPVGGIDSHGKIGSFADGHSGGYARSFAHSDAVASYRGAYGSADSGGGRNSGYSSGSYSSGSHYSGSGSYAGGSSHSSSGGSVSSSSSSSASSSSGGGSHGRP